MSETNGDNRKVICLGMPAYGGMSIGAAHAFHRCSRRADYHVKILALNTSLATQNMNRLWCWALNTARKGRVDYFAMQHSDIEPQEYWLDALIDELEAKQLDVLGVVAPIKDPRGMTSTAIAHPSGNPWICQNRIMMDEVYRLQETFTSEDIGGPLLLNTGLWACKFDMAWAPSIYFTVNDRIMLDRDGDYVAQVEPEDWFWSRVLHEIGTPGSETDGVPKLRIGCTRKVKLWHRGEIAFGNESAWGTDAYDKQWSEKSFLDGQSKDWFPHDAAGWLTEEEGRELARLAEGKVVLEIGAYAGRSTICLAQKAVTVGTIDTFDGRGTSQAGDTLPLFKRNIARAGVENKVTIYQGESQKMLRNLPPIYDLVFIDGSHDKESVLADAHAAAELLKPDGVLVFHDYGERDMGVTEAVDELVAEWVDAGVKTLRLAETLYCVQPAFSVAGV